MRISIPSTVQLGRKLPAFLHSLDSSCSIQNYPRPHGLQGNDDTVFRVLFRNLEPCDVPGKFVTCTSHWTRCPMCDTARSPVCLSLVEVTIFTSATTTQGKVQAGNAGSESSGCSITAVTKKQCKEKQCMDAGKCRSQIRSLLPFPPSGVSVSSI